MKDYYKINEIARLYGIGQDSLRYYERLGLLSPRRDTNGYRLVAAFGISPELGGRQMGGVTIRPLDELESFCLENKPAVAVLCVPRQSAVDLSDELVSLGIQGFWNFSHYDLSVAHPEVTVENVHLGDSLMSLGYRLRNQDS